MHRQAIYKSIYKSNTERRKTRREAGKVLVAKILNVNFFYCHLSFTIGKTATNTVAPQPMPVRLFPKLAKVRSIQHALAVSCTM